MLYWFGRADFAMRHLSIINEFIIAFVLKKFNIEKVFNFSNKILKFWLKRLKIQAKFISPSVFKLLNIFI